MTARMELLFMNFFPLTSVLPLVTRHRAEEHDSASLSIGKIGLPHTQYQRVVRPFSLCIVAITVERDGSSHARDNLSCPDLLHPLLQFF